MDKDISSLSALFAKLIAFPCKEEVVIDANLEMVDGMGVDRTYGGLRRVLTYGTFDLLHYGHTRLLRRAAALGDYLVVALSTDEFNAGKGKKSFYPYDVRREMLESIRYVDLVIPEYSWEQKIDDVKTYNIDVVVMGGDWAGSDRFEFLRDYCALVYLDRTPGISTTQVKQHLSKGSL